MHLTDAERALAQLNRERMDTAAMLSQIAEMLARAPGAAECTRLANIAATAARELECKSN